MIFLINFHYLDFRDRDYILSRDILTRDIHIYFLSYSLYLLFLFIITLLNSFLTIDIFKVKIIRNIRYLVLFSFIFTL